MTNIKVDKTILGKNNSVLNTDFSFFLKDTIVPEFTLEDFFQLYEELFYQIPKEGEVESHRYILNKEAEYLGVQLADDIDIQALLNEITSLRQQLLESKTIILNLQKNGKQGNVEWIKISNMKVETILNCLYNRDEP